MCTNIVLCRRRATERLAEADQKFYLRKFCCFYPIGATFLTYVEKRPLLLDFKVPL